MAKSNEADLNNSQNVDAIDSLFEYLTVTNPIVDMKAVDQLKTVLSEGQCFCQENLPIKKEVVSEALQEIQRCIEKDLKTRLVLTTWTSMIKQSALPLFKEREMYYGVKVLLSTTQDSDDEFLKWLNGLSKKLVTHEDEISKENSVFESLCKAVKVSPDILKSQGKINKWTDLKEMVKEAMLTNTAIPKSLIVSACAIKGGDWENSVKNDIVFTKFAPTCLPYVAAMLERNIKVYQYPEKEVVHFFSYTTPVNFEMIELCVCKGMFYPVISDNVDVTKKLHDKIKKQEKNIDDLKSQLEAEKAKAVQDQEKIKQLTKELKEAEKNISQYKQKYNEAIRDQDLIAERVAKQVVQEFRDGKHAQFRNKP